MTNVSSLITVLFVFLLSTLSPVYAASHEKAATDTATTDETKDTDKKKKEDEEEPDCD